jgi:hypothetical protein
MNDQTEEKKLTNANVIRTVSSNQHEIIRNIIKLHIPDGIECDPTYSKGVFYDAAGIDEPKYKFDLFPKLHKETKEPSSVQARAEDLPLDDESISSLMFDPPFMAGFTKPKPTGLMGERFYGYPYVVHLWKWYDECLVEFHRVLKKKGVLVIKCQDTVSSGKNWFSHVHIMNRALEAGFYPKDLFILTAKARLIGANHNNQKHARKFHSYFWVFEKKDCTVDYSIDRHSEVIDPATIKPRLPKKTITKEDK